MIVLTLRAFFWLLVSIIAVRLFGGQRCARRLLHAAGSLRMDPVRALAAGPFVLVA